MRWLLVATVVLLAACSVAEAQTTRKTYLPIAMRDGVPTATSTPTPTPRPGPDPRIVSASGRRSSSFHYVYFALKNFGSAPAYTPRVTVTYYDAGGAIVGSTTGGTHLSMVGPGETASGYTLTEPGAGWVRYELTGTYQTSSFVRYVHQGIDITEINSYRTGSTVYVVGRVTNNTGRTVRSPIVAVAVYSPTGTIIESGFSFPFSIGTVAPGQTTTFSESFFDPDNAIPTGYTFAIIGEASETA